MVYEKMCLPFCRRRRRRTVHNTNLLEKWLFSIIYCGKNIQSIFMKFSGFVYLVKGYCDSIYYGLRENGFTILSSSSSSDRP